MSDSVRTSSFIAAECAAMWATTKANCRLEAEEEGTEGNAAGTAAVWVATVPREVSPLLPIAVVALPLGKSCWLGRNPAHPGGCKGDASGGGTGVDAGCDEGEEGADPPCCISRMTVVRRRLPSAAVVAPPAPAWPGLVERPCCADSAPTGVLAPRSLACETDKTLTRRPALASGARALLVRVVPGDA